MPVVITFDKDTLSREFPISAPLKVDVAHLAHLVADGSHSKQSSAHEVLQFAPNGWDSVVEGHLRKRLWGALKIDDAGHMHKALRLYTTESEHVGGGWQLNKLLIRLRLAMWSKSAGKGPSGKRRGLLHAAAANVDGVPEGGAVRCLAKLIEIAPPDEEELWQVKTALADAERLGRCECCALLRHVLVGLETATSC